MCLKQISTSYSSVSVIGHVKSFFFFFPLPGKGIFFHKELVSSFANSGGFCDALPIQRERFLEGCGYHS